MASMEHAYYLAALAVEERLREQHPETLELLRSLTEKDVTVCSGSYDSVEEVLKRLAVPFQLDPSALVLIEKSSFPASPISARPDQLS